MKGCYCLIIHVRKHCPIKIGKKLGALEFERGIYVYVGFAMNSLKSRLNRHLSNEKKLHWHIDYLLSDENSKIIDIVYNESRKVECELSQYLSAKSMGVKDFGCSDCDCESHLYYFKNKKEAIEQIKNAYDSIAMEYKFFRI